MLSDDAPTGAPGPAHGGEDQRGHEDHDADDQQVAQPVRCDSDDSQHDGDQNEKQQESQASYIPRGSDEDPLVVKRWDYEPEVWRQLLDRYGYTDVRTQVLAAPPGPRTVGTLIVEAGV